jgi:dTDP-4-amino-4,6-dideoxygalactose transaminase
MLSPSLVAPQITDRTVAIMGVHLWGKACDPTGLEALADRHGVTLLFDACHGLGCTFGGRSLANFGLASAFSLHATKIVNAAEGGFVATNDPGIAARIRDIRNFYSAESGFTALRMNGKMSEAQALMALLSLDQYTANRELNLARYGLFRDLLSEIQGIHLVKIDDSSNFQYVVVEIDEDEFGLNRDTLRTLLNAENIYCRTHFHPGVQRKNPYLRSSLETGLRFPNSDRLSERVLQLPNGSAVEPDDVRQIAYLIAAIGRLSGAIKQRGLDA